MKPLLSHRTVTSFFMCKSSLVEDLQRNRSERRHVHREKVIIQNWLTQLWKQRSPQLCSHQAGDPGRPMLSFQPTGKGLRIRGA